eukprot:XP_011671892.1 PREDICTED: uncharacterized protein LOC100893593 [Strongylocentrotus purpuratus]
MGKRGYLKKLRRFGGASIGAFTACFLAVGHGPEEFDEILNGPQIKGLLDASFGKLSMVPNLYLHMGWHPGKAIDKFLGDAIEKKLGKADATFKDLYDHKDDEGKKKKIELCVVVTNLSTMMEEYCHVKTTPDMPIRLAVRMSTSIPGVLFPVTQRYMDRTDTYIDGGVICNYPVHCFDGTQQARRGSKRSLQGTTGGRWSNTSPQPPSAAALTPFSLINKGLGMTARDVKTSSPETPSEIQPLSSSKARHSPFVQNPSLVDMLLLVLMLVIVPHLSFDSRPCVPGLQTFPQESFVSSLTQAIIFDGKSNP